MRMMRKKWREPYMDWNMTLHGLLKRTMRLVLTFKYALPGALNKWSWIRDTDGHLIDDGK